MASLRLRVDFKVRSCRLVEAASSFYDLLTLHRFKYITAISAVHWIHVLPSIINTQNRLVICASFAVLPAVSVRWITLLLQPHWDFPPNQTRGFSSNHVRNVTARSVLKRSRQA